MPFKAGPTLPDMGKLFVEDRSAFGERLMRARLHAKMSQAALAKAAGLAQGTLSQLEQSGQGSAKVGTLAEVTGVRVQWLERGEEPMLDTSQVPAPAQQVASERVAHYLVGTPEGNDYRTIALSLAAALEESGTQLTVGQFIKLLEATYAKLRPDPDRQRLGL